ncbi:lipoprotein [Alphaproteobacteria bacterium GH1-50]|uniref:Lipoprotein n=1 Tax=Kangsaoukella pontilimi TaxID=2691042 RepID=A0A7C9IF20_9RHOB|nr:lipoprotein [Kangsaoukella pontilimi]MXQ07224.1 lipoprotein [Kangsaoukella pontilimi]
MKKIVLFAALLAGLAACNTIEGFGQDVSAGARAVDRAI